MSVEALTWLAHHAPDVKPHWMGTLFGLANHANDQGKGSHPSQKLLAWYARKDERAIREDLRAMEGAGLIRKGDQRMVAHLDPATRPVVWDLALEKTRGPRPAPGKPGRPRKPGGPEIPPEPETPGFSGKTPGSTEPPGSLDPPVFDLGKLSPDGKPGDLGTRQTNLGTEEVPPLPPGGGREREEQPAPSGASTDLTADEVALLAEITAAAPRWSPASLRRVIVAAEIRERTDRALVRLAFLLAAADAPTRSPRRLLHDTCPFWAQAERELYPPAPAGPLAAELIGEVPWCGDDGCDRVTRTLVHPDSGVPRPGRPRCPACHPQSPAGQP